MSDDETFTQKQVRLLLEQQCHGLGKLVRDALPAGTAFFLLIADIGERGNMAHIATIQRESLHELVREWLAKEGADPGAGWRGFASYIVELARVSQFDVELDGGGKLTPQALLDHCETMAGGAEGASAYVAELARVTGYTGEKELQPLLDYCEQLAIKAGAVKPMTPPDESAAHATPDDITAELERRAAELLAPVQASGKRAGYCVIVVYPDETKDNAAARFNMSPSAMVDVFKGLIRAYRGLS